MIKNISPLIIALIIVFVISSCAPNIDIVNEDFINQFGPDVARINQEREAFETSQKAPSAAKLPPKKISGWNDPAVIIGAAGTYKYKSAYIDTSQLKLKPQGEDNLPNMETLIQNQNYRRLPENMFDVKYLAVNYPDSYGTQPVSFDDIKIPAHDAYGIDTGLGEKNYFLLNGKVLQRSVDNINHTTADDDKEVRMILVKEQKAADRKKKLAILKSQQEERQQKGDKAENANQESTLDTTIN